MADGKELRKISNARLKSAKLLIDANDWHGAAYMMAYSLECALKSVICKTLHLIKYPEDSKKKHISTIFMTHKFQQLLIISGLEDIFSTRGPANANYHWDQFTLTYPEDWPIIRYNINPNWNKSKTDELYNHLLDPNDGIISIIKKKRKW